jgi:hypothetical protein
MVPDKTLSKVSHKQGDSHFWFGLMRVKNVFFSTGVFNLKLMNKSGFWKDKWLGIQLLMVQYPSLYQIVRHKSAIVASIFGSVPLNVSLCRALVGHNLVLWHNLVHCLVHVRLNTEKDYFSWNLTLSGQFTIQSMYRSMINNGYVFHHKALWKLKLSLKIKIFVWYLLRRLILTKDNLAKRN